MSTSPSLTLARRALPLWGLSAQTTVQQLHISENTTFLVTPPTGSLRILRLHRHGYHDRTAIASELAWMEALARDNILSTARVIRGRNAEAIQQCVCDEMPAHFLVLFSHLPGNEPQPEDDLRRLFRLLGGLAARSHLHSQHWRRPDFFSRPIWDENAVFGTKPLWGHWRDAPGVIPKIIPSLQAAEERIITRLAAYGKSPARFGLIHADMRLANLLIDADTTHVIDFDDCGFGWWMYDFAAAVSFFEDHPQIPTLKQSWLEAYQEIRPLDPKDHAEVDTLVMLRRLNLLGWLGTHPKALIAAKLRANFASVSANLARGWLEKS